MSGFADPVRQDTTRGTGADNDVIIVGPKRVMCTQRPHAGSPARCLVDARQSHADTNQRGAAAEFTLSHALHSGWTFI